MTDTPVEKGFWHVVRIGLRWLAHVILYYPAKGLIWLGTKMSQV